MQCQNCDRYLDLSWAFCPQCGQRVIDSSKTTTKHFVNNNIRAQVFEVIVRQALAGAPWREVCAGPMQFNGITEEEVEAEIKRRRRDN